MGISATGNKTILKIQGYVTSGSDNFGLKDLSKSEFDIVAPLPAEATSKTCTIYPGDPDATSSATIPIESDDNPNEAKSNVALALNSGSPEPLAVYTFSSSEIENLLAAAYQSCLEDKCSLEFANQILTIFQKEDKSLLNTIKSGLTTEIDNTQKIIDALNQLFKKINKFDESLNQRDQDKISALALKTMTSLSPDPLIGPTGLVEEGGYNFDPLSFLISNNVFDQSDSLKTKTNTALTAQVLAMASEALSRGATGASLGNYIFKTGPGTTSISKSMFQINQSKITLKTLSQASSLNESYIFGIAGLKNAKPYVEKVYNNKTSTGVTLLNLDNVEQVKFAGYMCSLLANEFALSAGLGRLEGTPLGLSFGSTGDYVQNFFGVTYDDVLTESTKAGSLSDFFVVDTDGNSNLKDSNLQGVLLLDGSKFKSTNNRKSCLDAFVAGMLRYPTDPIKNKILTLDKALVGSQKKFESGLEFYKKLHLRDKSLSLLTPRGLFTRIMRDFSESLSCLSSNPTTAIQTQTQREIALMHLLASYSWKSGYLSTIENIKQFIVSIIAKKAMLKNLGVPDLGNAGSQQEAQSSSASSPDQQKADAEKITNKSDKLRFSTDDTKIYESRFENKAPQIILDAMYEVPDSLVFSSRGEEETRINLVFSPNQFFESCVTTDNTLISKIAQIYLDLCDEALKNSRSESLSASFINSQRLTKNSQIDSTITISVLFEIMCLMCQNFSSAERIKTSQEKKLDSLTGLKAKMPVASGPNKDAEKIKSLKQTGDYALRFVLDIGPNSETMLAQKALKSIAAASLNNDFGSLVSYPAGGGTAYVPSLNNAPASISITPGSGAGVTFSTILSIMKYLAAERDLPAGALSVAKSMFDYAKISASDIVSLGNQLVGNDSKSDQAALLTDFSNTPVGAEYFASMNQNSLEISQRYLNKLKNALNSASGRNPKMTIGEYNCLKVVLPKFVSDLQTKEAIFLTVALPTDFIKKSIDPTFDLTKDKGDAVIDFLLDKKSFLESVNPYLGTSFSFLVQSTLTEDSFSGFEGTLEPTSVSDVMSRVILSGIGTGEEFVNSKQDKNRSYEILTREVTSYLLRKLFSTLSSVDLFEENLMMLDQNARSEGAASLAKNFARFYSIPENTFDPVFFKTKSGNITSTILSKEALYKLTVPDFSNTKNSVSIEPAVLNFGEAEMFYDLFSTIYFMQGMIQQKVFSPSAVDKIVGILHSEKSFKTFNQFYGIEENAAAQETSTFNTYNVKADKGTTLFSE